MWTSEVAEATKAWSPRPRETQALGRQQSLKAGGARAVQLRAASLVPSQDTHRIPPKSGAPALQVLMGRAPV